MIKEYLIEEIAETVANKYIEHYGSQESAYDSLTGHEREMFDAAVSLLDPFDTEATPEGLKIIRASFVNEMCTYLNKE